NTSGAIGERPMISQSGAYSKLVNPAPYSLSGKNKFHSPCSFAFAFISSITGGIRHRLFPLLSCSVYTLSLGYTTSSINFSSLLWRRLTFSEWLKFPPSPPPPCHPLQLFLR